jgi:hypothetical protein
MIGERDSSGGADASRCTGDQRDFPIQFSVHDLKYRPGTEKW